MDLKFRITEYGLFILLLVPIFMVLSRKIPYFAKRDKERLHKEAIENLRMLWWRCPACNESFSGHQKIRLASVILDPDTHRADELRRLVREHQWEKAMQ